MMQDVIHMLCVLHIAKRLASCIVTVHEMGTAYYLRVS